MIDISCLLLVLDVINEVCGIEYGLGCDVINIVLFLGCYVICDYWIWLGAEGYF